MSFIRFGADNNMWKGGRFVASNGYILIRVGHNHHLADVNGYAYEHRLIAEQNLGRRLRRGEQIHHIDGDKINNNPLNIEVYPTRAAHYLQHRRKDSIRRKPEEPNPVIICICGCGIGFSRYDNSGRPRRFISGHNQRRRREQEEIRCTCGCGGRLQKYSKQGQEVRFMKGHRPGRKNIGENLIVPCRCGCGRSFKKYDQWNRPRIYISGHNGRKEVPNV